MNKSLSTHSLCIIVSVFLLVIGSLLAVNLWFEWEETFEREQERLETQAQVIRENMHQNLDAVDLVLKQLRDDVITFDEYQPSFNHDLEILTDALPSVRTIFVMDAKGAIIYSNRDLLINRDFSQREYFKTPQKMNDTETLYISNPFLTVLDVITISLARVIPGPNGEFTGVVGVSLDTEYFSPLLSSVLYSPNMHSAIAHGGGKLLVTVPDNIMDVDLNLAQNETLFNQHQSSDDLFTTYVGSTPVVEGDQVSVWTTIQQPHLKMDFPLLAFVSRDYDAVSAPWFHDALIQLILYGTLVITCLSALGIFNRRQAAFLKQQEASQLFIKEQSESARMASNAVSLGFWDYNIVSKTLRWDDRMYRIFGCSRNKNEDLSYNFWSKTVHPNDLARSEQELNDAINGIREFDTEYRIIRPTGEVRIIKAVASSTRDENGNVIKLFGINYDVTDSRRSEQKQIELVDQLTRINEELNNFTYVASHDLKSPLRGIDQLASWINEDLGDDLNEQTKEHLKLMRTRIKRMEMLLDDLLAYSRVGRADGEIVEVDTKETIEAIFDMSGFNDKIQFVVADEMPTIQIKKVPFELIFRNLISNAIKHHDKEQGKITVSARSITNGFEFEITDDGPGIPLEHQKRVFDIFQTLRPRDEVEGSGIGLSIVKKAADSVGGTIFLESDGVHGCTFRFFYPIN